MNALSHLQEEADGRPKKFAALTCNPPYQWEGPNSVQVYPLFYLSGRNLAKVACFVTPRGWQTSTGGSSFSTLHPEMRADPAIALVDNYLETAKSPVKVFPQVGTGGVSVILRSETHTKNRTTMKTHGKVSGERNLANPSFWPSATEEIFRKMKQWCEAQGVGTMKEKLWGGNAFRFNTNYTTDEQHPAFKVIKYEAFPGGVKFYARAPHGGRRQSAYGYCWIPEDFPHLRLKFLQDWKVVWPEAGNHYSYRRSLILPPGVGVSATFIGASFKSEDEAKSFQSYFSTHLYRFLLSQRATNQHGLSTFHEFVPDLSHVVHPQTGVKGWASEWTDEALKLLLKGVLTPEDWEYLERVAQEADPAPRGHRDPLR